MSISLQMDNEDLVHTHNGICSVIKKNELTKFVGYWLELEIFLSEVA